jgi:hypothetical protein
MQSQVQHAEGFLFGKLGMSATHGSIPWNIRRGNVFLFRVVSFVFEAWLIWVVVRV